MSSTVSRTLSVHVIADPGLPSRRTAAVEEELLADLRRTFGEQTTLTLRTQSILVGSDYLVSPEDMQGPEESQGQADLLVLLTEMPRHAQGAITVAEVFHDRAFALVSCPPLGLLKTKERLRRVIMACLLRLSGGRGQERPSWPGAPKPPRADWSSDEQGARDRLVVRSPLGTLRTVLGMVASNDPWRTAPRLSSAMAAAAGVGSFGIFYSSIWQMADFLSTARLLGIAVMALVLIVAWLLLGHRLWDHPRDGTSASTVTLYNASTVATLLVVTTGLYLGLFLFILVSGSVVIAPGFMSQTLGKTADFGNYVRVAWLSAAMGVVAGSLGTSFDSETDLRRLTHGQRERQRVLTEDRGTRDAQDTVEDHEA